MSPNPPLFCNPPLLPSPLFFLTFLIIPYLLLLIYFKKKKKKKKYIKKGRVGGLGRVFSESVGDTYIYKTYIHLYNEFQTDPPSTNPPLLTNTQIYIN